MSLEKWTKLSSEVFHKNKWWQGLHDRFRLPNGKEGDYFYTKTPGAVMIIAVDNNGKVLLHRQYRYLFDKESLELPCGGIKPGQTTEEAARAELAEETNFQAETMEFIGTCGTAPALMKEIFYVFLAKGLSPVLVEKDDTEFFDQVRMSPNEIDSAIQSGEIFCSPTITGWVLAKPFL
ncbi:MAG: NUDIX hydrolase [Candidatus Uhrbacteria bacterium]